MAKDPNELTTWEPFGGMTPLREAFNRLLEDSFIGPGRFDVVMGRSLPLDVYETENAYVVEASLPGVTPENLNVTATDDTVTIRATMRRVSHEGEKGSYLRRERHEGETVRSVSLPTSIDPAKVTASFEHGVLKLTAPKSEAAKPRQIEVQIH